MKRTSDFRQHGLLVVKPNVTMTVRLFGTKLHELAKVYVTTNKRQCSHEAFVHQAIEAETFAEMSPHTVTFSFRFPWPKRQYYFCFEWRDENLRGVLQHQGVGRYQHIETRAPVRDRDRDRDRDREVKF